MSQSHWPEILPGVWPCWPNFRGGSFLLAMVGSQFLEPIWDDSDGNRVSFLCETVVFNPGTSKSLVKSVLHKRFIKLDGEIPEAFAYSILDGIWNKQLGTVTVDASSFVIPHRVATTETLTGVTELCAGIGAMSFGLEVSGCHIHVKNDIRLPFTEFLGNDGFNNTVCGDISLNETIFKIYDKYPHSSILTAGFSCQPWSRLGDSGKMQDARSHTLVSALRAGFFLRSSAIILECVAESGQDPDVQSVIQGFCQQTGFWKVEQVLYLEHVWPSRRKRWWCLLVNPIIPRFDFKPFPKHPFVPTVGQVLPIFPNWPEPELQQLLIDEYEYGCFEKFTGIPKVAIDLNQPLPTALHGWGNQLMGCPCTCRKGPLSLGRLQEKGLWGAVLPLPWEFKVQGHQVQACRHIHPWELSILTGAVADRKWMPHLKLSRCGLGQMATPFQSAWIASHLTYHTGRFFGWEQCITPEQALWAVASRAFASRDSCLPQLSQLAQIASFVDCAHLLLFGSHQDRFVPQSVQLAPQDQAMHSHGEGLVEGDDEKGVVPAIESLIVNEGSDLAPGDISNDIIDDGYADPHWDCPFDDCIICIMNGLKPPPHDAAIVHHDEIQTMVSGDTEVEVSPTLPFVVDGHVFFSKWWGGFSHMWRTSGI